MRFIVLIVVFDAAGNLSRITRVIRFAKPTRSDTQIEKAGTFYCALNGRLEEILFMFSHSLYHGYLFFGIIYHL